jgi:hypothetical protein
VIPGRLISGNGWQGAGVVCRGDSSQGCPNRRLGSEAAMDLPRTSLMGEDVCDANRGGRLHPIGLACPRCRRADAGPPPRPPHPAGLPLRPLWAAVQGLHRHGPVRQTRPVKRAPLVSLTALLGVEPPPDNRHEPRGIHQPTWRLKRWFVIDPAPRVQRQCGRGQGFSRLRFWSRTVLRSNRSWLCRERCLRTGSASANGSGERNSSARGARRFRADPSRTRDSGQ